MFSKPKCLPQCPYNHTKEQTFYVRWHQKPEFTVRPIRGYHLVEGPIRRHHSISGPIAMLSLIQITTVSTCVPFGNIASYNWNTLSFIHFCTTEFPKPLLWILCWILHHYIDIKHKYGEKNGIAFLRSVDKFKTWTLLFSKENHQW